MTADKETVIALRLSNGSLCRNDRSLAGVSVSVWGWNSAAIGSKLI